MRDFAGRVAVITGGASGIGRAIATSLASQGARVVIADVVEDVLAKTCADLSARGLTVEGRVTDVTREDSVEALAAHVFGTYGNVHLVFNNAGVGVNEARRKVWELHPKEWAWAYAVNVMGVMHGIRAFVPRMLEAGEEGAIVNTVSGNGGVASLPTTPIYASSKAAATSLTEVLHAQLVASGSKITAHALFPGPFLVDTDILNSDRARTDAYRHEGQTPSPHADMKALAASAGVEFKLTQPEEVAEMALEGVREGRFWILSPLGKSNENLLRRTQSILDRENPKPG